MSRADPVAACCSDQSRGCCNVFAHIAAHIGTQETPEAFRARMQDKRDKLTAAASAPK